MDIDYYFLNGIFGVCVFIRFDMEREEVGLIVRFGIFLFRILGEVF